MPSEVNGLFHKSNSGDIFSENTMLFHVKKNAHDKVLEEQRGCKIHALGALSTYSSFNN